MSIIVHWCTRFLENTSVLLTFHYKNSGEDLKIAVFFHHTFERTKHVYVCKTNRYTNDGYLYGDLDRA